MITQQGNIHAFMLGPCTADILRHALDPSVPWIWIRRHTPKRNLGWWPTKLPLSERGAPCEVTARSLEFDLLLPTVRFLELLPEFHDHGVTLYQMVRPVPDTLSLDRVPPDAIDPVLVQNGLHLAFHLPHAIETAEFRSPHREVLAALLAVPEIRALAFEDT
jgi:hypothetical protein